MAVTNYTTLKSEIASWMNRSTLGDAIDTAIDNAEAHFTRMLVRARDPRLITEDAAYTTTGALTSLPTGFRSMERIVHDRNLLRFLTVEQAEARRTASGGPPVFYYIDGDKIGFVPEVGAGEVFNIAYWGALPALSNTTTSNWFLEAYPDAYLYRALFECAVFIRDARRAADFAPIYGEIEAGIKRDSHRRRFGVAPAMRNVV